MYLYEFSVAWLYMTVCIYLPFTEAILKERWIPIFYNKFITSVVYTKADFSFTICIIFQVEFLRYTQQWKKKVVFVLNKSDLYQTPQEV